jgi:hypothetical protein
MLTPRQVIPFLSSDNDVIRSLAESYLDHAHDPSPATGDDVWAAVHKLGIKRAKPMLRLLEVLPQTSESLKLTIQAYHEHKDTPVQHRFNNVLNEVSIDLLLSHRNELLDPALGSRIVEHHQERLKLRDKSLDELWNELLRLCDTISIADADDNDEVDSDTDSMTITLENELFRVVEALGQRQDAAGRAMELLTATSVGNLREVAAVDVLGMLRHRPAASALLDKLLIKEANFIQEFVEIALPRMADDERVAQIEAFHRANPGTVRSHTSAILGRIKLPSSEAALLRLIEEERRTPHFSILADSLLVTCSAAAIPALHKTAQVGGSILSFIDLRSMLAAVSYMTDTPFPEAEHWLAEAGEQERKMALRHQQMEDFMALSGARGNGSAFEPEAPDGDYDPIAAPVTIRREEPKIGRNDPCPCGSGKKYKKCCLKSA